MTGARPLAGRQVLVATRNVGKLREFRPMFDSLGATIVDLETAGIPETPEEDAIEAHDSFEANALAKARYYHAASGGLPTVADDSGLEVAALGGRPGVRSKRYAGATGSSADVERANNALLLRELAGQEDRSARFVCAAAYVDDSRELVRVGTVAGRILDAPRGSGGFGYDPLFYAADLGTTFAEATREEKSRISHRGRAFAALAEALADQGGEGRQPVVDAFS